MIFWEAEEPALILRHRAHRNGTEKIKLIGILQNSPWIKNTLNINKRNGVTSLPCCFPRIPLCRIVHGSVCTF